MNTIEKIIKEYSTQKLKTILLEQSSTYNKNFIDYSKNELIRRGEDFTLDVEIEKELAAENDEFIKNIIEKEWMNFHLEYLEIARKEYIKRGLKNEGTDLNLKANENYTNRYPNLIKIASAYNTFAWIVGIIAALIAVKYFNLRDDLGIIIAISSLISGALIVLILLTTSELIKVFIDTEENTRI